MRDRLLDALAGGIRVYDLGRPLFVGMPQSPAHPEYRLVIPRRHGDLVRGDGSSGANELIMTGGHVGTHIDALAHISFRGRLHGGVDAAAAQIGGRFSELGIETVEPMVARGVLLDVAKVLDERCARHDSTGVQSRPDIAAPCCPADYEVTPSDLDAALCLTGVDPAPGDVLLIRTGWGRNFDDRARYEGDESGTPGPGEAGAQWLADLHPRAVGSDTIAFDRIPAATVDYLLPAHRLLLVEKGIHIIEVLNLEELAAAQIYEFTFILSPLKLIGATGSPVRPLALVDLNGHGD